MHNNAVTPKVPLVIGVKVKTPSDQFSKIEEKNLLHDTFGVIEICTDAYN